MSCFVHWTVWMLKISHQNSNRFLRRCHQVYGFHGCQRLTTLVQIFNHCGREGNWKNKYVKIGLFFKIKRVIHRAAKCVHRYRIRDSSELVEILKNSSYFFELFINLLTSCSELAKKFKNLADFSKNSSKLVKTRRNFQKFIHIFWKWVEIFENSSTFFEKLSKFIKIRRNFQKFVKIRRNSWKFVGILENSSKFFGICWNYQKLVRSLKFAEIHWLSSSFSKKSFAFFNFIEERYVVKIRPVPQLPHYHGTKSSMSPLQPIKKFNNSITYMESLQQ